MSGYVKDALHQFNHVKPKIHNISHIQHQKLHMVQMPKELIRINTSPALYMERVKKIEKIVVNYYITRDM